MLPDLDDFLLVRDKPHIYFLLLPCIVGKVNWKKATPGKLVTQVATPSYEALALLILENSWDVWNQESVLAVGQTLHNNKKERTNGQAMQCHRESLKAGVLRVYQDIIVCAWLLR
jgi:hypothetical protein